MISLAEISEGPRLICANEDLGVREGALLPIRCLLMKRRKEN